MGRIGSRIAALAGSLAATATFAVEPTATAIEYYNTNIGHYFITADAGDVQVVESGAAGPGWSRTGGEFGVFKSASDAPGLAAVCRFYSPKFNSHFYTANADECALVKGNPDWKYETIAFYVATPGASGCAGGTTAVYRGFNAANPNHRFTVDPTVYARAAASGLTPEGAVMCAPLSSADLQADAVRLLRQATFGATPAEAQRAAAMGPAAWIDEQLAMARTAYPDYPYTAANRPTSCVDDRTPPIGPTSFCARDNYSLFPLQLQFFRNAMTQPDQLHQRVAFALSQILVTSGVENPRNYAMRNYQQLIADHALGNYYDLLVAVTLSPVMGDYLNMANNNKDNPQTHAAPNENYAREILQLFSIGLVALNADGTVKRDANGNAIPTYDQDVIEGFAHVFTGWTFAPVTGAPMRNNNPRNFEGAMVAVDADHDFGLKLLLDGHVASIGLSMADDLAFAHRTIFNHPNVGPFIGRQLIQKLVTSDPTPAYVARVASVFADNGAGVRGDLRAVVRAILLDPEARGARKIDPGYGKLIEPVLLATNALRATGARTDGVFPRAQAAALAQNVFYAPTVFNYYPPGYVVPATRLNGPEFALLNSATALGRANFVNALLYGTINPDPTVYGATGTQIDLSAYTPLAGTPQALVDRLGGDLLAGNLSAAMRNAVVTAVNAVPASDAAGRVRAALYLFFASSQFQVQR